MGKITCRKILALAILAYSVVTSTLDTIGRVDTIIAHRDSPTTTWLGRLTDWLLAPPEWLVLPLVAMGFGLLWWDKQRTRPRDHIADLRAVGQLEDKELLAQVSKWLAARLSDKNLNVRAIHLFGSVVRGHYPTSDVDVIVDFKEVPEREIASAVRRIKDEVAADFLRTFGHRLHVTFFCAGEDRGRAEFLIKAGDPHPIFSATAEEENLAT